jgi:hypothetical protein
MALYLNKEKYRKDKEKLDNELKELQNQKENMQLDIQLINRKNDIKNEDEKREVQLKHDDELRALEREKAEQKEDFERKSKNLEEDYQRKLTEKEGLIRLKNEQDLAQLKVDAESKALATSKLHNKEMSNIKDTLAKQHFEEVKKVFKDLNMEGDKNFKFLHELSLAMLQVKPAPMDTNLNVDIDRKDTVELLEDSSKKKKSKNK